MPGQSGSQQRPVQAGCLRGEYIDALVAVAVEELNWLSRAPPTW
jgi:hypothetical protein